MTELQREVQTGHARLTSVHLAGSCVKSGSACLNVVFLKVMISNASNARSASNEPAFEAHQRLYNKTKPLGGKVGQQSV